MSIAEIDGIKVMLRTPSRREQKIADAAKDTEGDRLHDQFSNDLCPVTIPGWRRDGSLSPLR
jgi:hypothetical protein